MESKSTKTVLHVTDPVFKSTFKHYDLPDSMVSNPNYFIHSKVW